MQVRAINYFNLFCLSVFYNNLNIVSTNVIICTTPQNASGICLALADCPFLLKMYENDMLSDKDKMYLRQCQCGYNNQEEIILKKVLVCCSQSQSSDDVSLVTGEHEYISKNNTMNGNTIGIKEINSTKSVTIYGTCTTPENAIGNCLALADCPYLHEMFTNNARSDKDILYLRQCQCGYESSNENYAKKVLVCCSQRQLRNLNINNLAQPGDILPDISECGFFLNFKIYGGNKTEIGEFPWIVLLEYKNRVNNNMQHLCGGTLINSRYVITAAHCINDLDLQKKWELSRVRLGEWDTNTDPDCEIYVNGHKDCALSHRDIDVENFVVHEEYVPNSRNIYHDIALIRLAESVAYNIYVRPICLPLIAKLRYSQFNDFIMEVAGWGKTKAALASHIKMKMSVKVWSLDDCQVPYKILNQVLNETQLCAGGEQDIDSCYGDSGGPLMIQEELNNRKLHFLAGIVSYGSIECGIKGWPTVYTRVGNYIDWIISNLKP